MRQPKTVHILIISIVNYINKVFKIVLMLCRYLGHAKIQHKVSDALISLLSHTKCAFEIRTKMSKSKMAVVVLDSLREHKKIPSVTSNLLLLLAHLADGNPMVQRQVQWTTLGTIAMIVDIV